MNIVVIYGAKTLERYTKKILIEGFRGNFWEAREASLDWEDSKNIKTDAVLFQLHGGPQSEKDDRAIIESIARFLSKEDNRKKVILLHRPDELQKYQDLPNILSRSVERVGLVFFGPRFAADEFYPSTQRIIKKVIPHGFFPMESRQKVLQENPVVIGSHTTWGEMRSTEHALRLLREIFFLNRKNRRNILGYLGGKPAEELHIEHLKNLCEKINSEIPIEFLNVHTYTSCKEIIEKYPNANIILVDTLDKELSFFSLTFNLQIYYFGNTIRLGESSGSAHSSVSIPVAAEINDADLVEDVQLIKIPYENVNDVGTLDFKEGAKQIIDSINDNRFRDMWKHNLIQSEIWDNTRIGKEYLALFRELG